MYYCATKYVSYVTEIENFTVITVVSNILLFK